MSGAFRITPGRPDPAGATPDAAGVNFAVRSAHAARIDLCLFDAMGRETRLTLPGRDGDIHHGHVAGLGPGAAYGFRAHGRWAPAEGHWFNPAKLLLDPCARRLSGPVVWDRAMQAATDEDSAGAMPRCIVAPILPPPSGPPPMTDPRLICEAQVRALTLRMPGVERPGTFAALGSDALIDRLLALGVDALELLPVMAFADDRHLVERGLTNHWGYQPVALMAPEPRLAATDDPAAELQAAVARLRGAGIAVILDIVVNHTGEGDADGPAISLRGLDNAGVYRLGAGGAHVNDTGCGNTLDCTRPAVVRWIMDALRFWAGGIGVDGFRFDLAAVMGRGPAGFDPDAPLLTAIRQDPLLRGRLLIAEPWDLGPGGYAAGRFPHPFREWNDGFRDAVRRFWRADAGAAPGLAAALAGSAARFDHSGRDARASVNYVTAHDGFTLRDLVSYRRRHNEANGEGNRDGHADNLSDNLGHEGHTGDPAVARARLARMRAMLATLFVAQGTPMILAGDAIGHSQGGNNNAYAQDNATTWLDWPAGDAALAGFVARLAALRRGLPALSQRAWLHGAPGADGRPDIAWWREDGAPMTAADWQDPGRALVVAEFRMAAGAVPAPGVLAILNAAPTAAMVTPPDPAPAPVWRLALDSARPWIEDGAPAAAPLRVAGQSVVVLTA